MTCLIMESLKSIVGWIRAHRCERLVKYQAWKLQISGASVGAGPVKADVAKVSTRLEEIVPASMLATALDDSQYLLCTTAASMANSNPMKDDIQNARVAIILGITQLRVLVASLDRRTVKELRKELKRWIIYMNRLLKDVVRPFVYRPHAGIPRYRIASIQRGRKSLRQIMRYQGVKEQWLKELEQWLKPSS